MWGSWNLSNNQHLPGNDKWFEDSIQQLLENVSLDEHGPSENNHQFGYGFDPEPYSENQKLDQGLRTKYTITKLQSKYIKKYQSERESWEVKFNLDDQDHNNLQEY